ncbi:MAG TPA: tetratricopeptide repeat protein, partial [Allocoleopsis sp.]
MTFESLYANLPLTKDQVKVSNDSIQQALFVLGKAYIQEIEDCSAGTETLEQLRSRYPDFSPMDEVLFNLYYCYNKNGETAKASAIKKLMIDKYGNSNLTTIASTGKDPVVTRKDQATRTYENIYDMFIEGRFDEAVAAKRSADSVYGNSYWTPQLLYIESVYYVRQRNDSAATRILQNIINQFPNTPLSAKAATMIDVLSRRAQIEEELRNMVVTRATDSTTGRTIVPVAPKVDTSKVTNPVTNPVVNNPITTQPPKDTVVSKPIPKSNTPFSFDPNAAYYVVLVLN